MVLTGKIIILISKIIGTLVGIDNRETIVIKIGIPNSQKTNPPCSAHTVIGGAMFKKHVGLNNGIKINPVTKIKIKKSQKMCRAPHNSSEQRACCCE